MNIKYNICFLFIFSYFIAGCDAAYLPWNAGTRWNIGETDGSSEEDTIVTNYALQTVEDLEDFCGDNSASVELYRSYLLPSYSWDRRLSPSQIESRKENIQSFLEQYDRICN